MKHVKTAGMVGALLATVAMTAMAGDTKAKSEKLLDEAKGAVTPGQVVLTGSEVKTLHDGKDIDAYRVCVKADKEAGTVKVMNDAKFVTIKPGDCQQVAGMKITATPALPLSGTQHSTVTFDKHQ